jgi:hypothetical protein
MGSLTMMGHLRPATLREMRGTGRRWLPPRPRLSKDEKRQTQDKYKTNKNKQNIFVKI